jgi:hypothetical protein
VERAARLLRRQENTPLLIIRPLVSPVSQPISAASDDAAIFELLAQVGCGLPKGVDHG